MKLTPTNKKTLEYLGFKKSEYGRELWINDNSVVNANCDEFDSMDAILEYIINISMEKAAHKATNDIKQKFWYDCTQIRNKMIDMAEFMEYH